MKLFWWVPGRVHEVVYELREGFNVPPRYETMPPSIIPCGAWVLKTYLNGVSYFASPESSGKLIVEGVFEKLVSLREAEAPGNLPSKWVPIRTSRLPLRVKHVLPPPFPLLLVFHSENRECLCKVTVASPRRFLREATAWVSHVFKINVQNTVQEYAVEDFLRGKALESGAYVFTHEAFRVLAKPFGGVVVRTPLTLNTKPTPGGSVVLGEILDHLSYPTGNLYSVPLGQMHTLIIGSTGSGKTTSAARLAYETAKAGLKTAVLDWAGEYSALLPYGETFRPSVDFSLPLSRLGLKVVFETLKYYAESVWDTVLSPMQYSILRRAVWYSKGNPEGVFRRIEGEAGSSRRDVRQAANALLNKLEPIREVLRQLGSSMKPPLTIKYLPKLAIVDLGFYETFEEKALAAQLTLHTLIAQLRSAIVEKPVLHVVLEEAQHYLKTGAKLPTLIEEALMEHRKHGINLTLTTPNPRLPETIVLNTQLIVAHRANTLAAALKIAELITPAPQLTQTYAKYLKQQPTGQAIVTSPIQPQPTLVQIEPPQKTFTKPM